MQTPQPIGFDKGVAYLYNIMENFDSFQNLLEIITLILTLSAHSPVLGIVAGFGAICLLITNNHN